jgi:hypothetical protein
LLRTLADFWRFRIRRLYWIVKPDAADVIHIYPNRDAMRHEAHDCWCGPKVYLNDCDCDHDCWVNEHHSLDAREGRQR